MGNNLRATSQAKISKAVAREERKLERYVVKSVSSLIPGSVDCTIYIDRTVVSGELSLDTTVTIDREGTHFLINKRGIHALSSSMRKTQVDNIIEILERILFD